MRAVLRFREAAAPAEGQFLSMSGGLVHVLLIMTRSTLIHGSCESLHNVREFVIAAGVISVMIRCGQRQVRGRWRRRGLPGRGSDAQKCRLNTLRA